MLSFIKEIFQPSNNSGRAEHFNEIQKIHLAACTLMIEIAKADSQFSADEYNKIGTVLQKMFNLNDEQIHELMELADDWIKKSVSMYEFTSIINKHFSQDEKYELVKNLWKIVYADSVLDKYEDHLIRIVSNNLNLSKRDLIAAKLDAKSIDGKE